MKNKIILFITGCITLLLASCLDSDDNYTDVTEIKDAQIASLSLSHDSIKGLSDVKFTIDQLNGYIFNIDSMPYGTDIEKVVCSLSYTTGAAGIQISPEALGDTTYWWNGSDSIDFSQPVNFTVTAYDNVTTKRYRAWVNIHKVVPDSMVWIQYANNITGRQAQEQKVIVYPYNGTDHYFMYTKSSDGYELYHAPVDDARNWEKLTLTGFSNDGLVISQITEYDGVLYIPSANGTLYQSINGMAWVQTGNAPSVKYLLGSLKEGTNQPSALSAIIEQEETLHFAAMDNENRWTVGNIVPENFPVTGFGNISYTHMYHEYLMIIAGRDQKNRLTNAAWGTMNATNWALLSNENSPTFEKKEGVILAKYDDKFFLAGGINADNRASKEIHLSLDNGITWSKQDSLLTFPQEYVGRGFSSVHVDNNNYMLIFGGKTSRNTTTLDEVWRGRINRLGF